jgi:hypothetical protein
MVCYNLAKAGYMNLDVSPQELEELKELIEYSIHKITSEIQHVRSIQTRIELKEKRDELIQILNKIQSLEDQRKAA